VVVAPKQVRASRKPPEFIMAKSVPYVVRSESEVQSPTRDSHYVRPNAEGNGGVSKHLTENLGQIGSIRSQHGFNFRVGFHSAGVRGYELHQFARYSAITSKFHCELHAGIR